MGKVFFVPVSVASGFAAGFISKKVFDTVWGMIDDEEPPNPEHREVNLVKMGTALALQGAVFTVTRGLVDHQMRTSFYRATGRWPGEEEPEAK